MEEAIGTIIVFGLAGLIFGDEPGRKIAPYLIGMGVLFGCINAVLTSRSIDYIIGTLLAPFAIVILVLGGLIGFLRGR